MQIPLQSIARACWLAVGFTFSLSAVSFLRLDYGPYHLAIPTICLLLACVFSIGAAARITDAPLPRHRALLHLLCTAFLLLHIVQVVRVDFGPPAQKELITMISSIGIFWTVYLFFPRDRDFAHHFFRLFLVGNTILVGLLIYKYTFTFQRPYLGTNIFTADRTGKNRLAWHLILSLPMVVAMVWSTRKKFLAMIPLIVIIMGIIHAGSRAVWFTYIGIGCYIAIRAFRHEQRFGIRVAGFLCLMTGLAFGCLSQLNASVFNGFKARALSLVRPGTLSADYETILRDQDGMLHGKYSYADRGRLTSAAIQHITETPFFGAGLAGTNVEPHNDYLLVTCELGSIGLIVFLFVLGTAGTMIFQFSNDDFWIATARRATFLALCFLSLFFDIYRTNTYWVVLGLCMTCATRQKGHATENVIDS